MGELLTQVVQPLTLSCIGFVVVFALISILAMWSAKRTTTQNLEDIREAPEKASGTGPVSALSNAWIRRLENGRTLLTERADVLLERWLELHVLRLARFEAGSWITGVALFLTFFLIALVLAKDVGPAIANAGTESTANLAQAVRTMGAKFVVSMAGILMSIAHGVFRARFLHALHTAAAEAGHRLHHQAISVQDLHLEHAADQAKSAEALHQATRELHRALAQQHTESITRIDSLKTSVESLHSIEVSVKDIGSELGKSLQQMVKKDIVEGIRTELQDVVDGMQRALTESFTENINTNMSAVVTELRKIEGAVSSQGHSQVEGLLHKLSDAVSGGFASESSRMKDVLTRFAEVIPTLEQQLRAVSQSTGQEMAQRQAESTRTTERLLERLGAVLERAEVQHQQASAATEQMQQIMLHNQKAAASTAAEASEVFAYRSRAALDELTTALQGATGSATKVYGSLVSEVEQSARLLQQARTDASDGAARLTEANSLLRTTLTHVSSVVSGLQQVGGSLSAGIEQARSTVENGSAVLRSSAESVSQHQRFIEEFASRWPELTRQYLATSDQAFTKVASAWQAQADNIGNAVGRIGDSFAGSAGEFAEAVNDLSGQLERLRKDKALLGVG